MSVKPTDGEHPRRRERIQPEHRESEHVHERERGPERAVDVRTPPPQPAEQSEGDHEVSVVVVVGGELRKRRMRDEPAVHREFGIEMQRLLGVPDAPRVVDRHVNRSGATLVSMS